MKKTMFTLLRVFSIITILVSVSSPASADNDATIKATCNKESQTIILRIPYPYEKKGREAIYNKILSRKIKDGYSFNSMAKTHKKIICDLGNGYVFSFAAFKSLNHPGNDNLEMFVNKKHTSVWFQTTPMENEVHFVGAGDYITKECPLSPTGDSVEEGKCQQSHIVIGDRVKE